jgi:hypothetical protein
MALLSVRGESERLLSVMHFRHEATLRGFQMQSDPAQVSFTTPEAPGVLVSLRAPTKEEVEKANPIPGLSGSNDARGLATYVQDDVPPDVLAAFEALAERRLPDSSPRGLLGSRWVDGEGNFTKEREIVQMSHLAEPVRDFVIVTRAILRLAIREVLGATAWRMAIDSSRNPVQYGAASWSLDGDSWERFPVGATRATAFLSGEGIYRMHVERAGDIQALLDAGQSEPLAHSLWREASTQRSTNPRSAILLGIIALEVGIKQFAAARVPDADWLLKETQAPPIAKMLTRFLPQLPPADEAGKEFERPDKATMRTIGEGVELRNEIAHRGLDRDPPRKTVETILSTVRDLLWQLDAATGLDWAERHRNMPDDPNL